VCVRESSLPSRIFLFLAGRQAGRQALSLRQPTGKRLFASESTKKNENENIRDACLRAGTRRRRRGKFVPDQIDEIEFCSRMDTPVRERCALKLIISLFGKERTQKSHSHREERGERCSFGIRKNHFSHETHTHTQCLCYEKKREICIKTLNPPLDLIFRAYPY
jgi:hypothetical protein